MEHCSDIPCQWSGCEAAAVKDVGFRFRRFQPETMSVLHELNLCDLHIAEVKRYFLLVIEDDLGEPNNKPEDGNNSSLKHAA